MTNYFPSFLSLPELCFFPRGIAYLHPALSHLPVNWAYNPCFKKQTKNVPPFTMAPATINFLAYLIPGVVVWSYQ